MAKRKTVSEPGYCAEPLFECTSAFLKFAADGEGEAKVWPPKATSLPAENSRSNFAVMGLDSDTLIAALKWKATSDPSSQLFDSPMIRLVDGDTFRIDVSSTKPLDELPQIFSAIAFAADDGPAKLDAAVAAIYATLAIAKREGIRDGDNSLEAWREYEDFQAVVHRFVERLNVRKHEPLAIRGQKDLESKRKGADRTNTKKSAVNSVRNARLQADNAKMAAEKPGLSHAERGRRQAIIETQRALLWKAAGKPAVDSPPTELAPDTVRKLVKNPAPKNRGGRRRKSGESKQATR